MLFKLFKIFLYLSTFTVGGGAAMIPLINKEIVEKNKFMTEEEFIDALGIAQSTPGVLGANISIIVGYKIAGISGAIVCLLCSIFPAFASILIVSIYFRDVSSNYYVNKFFIAVKPALVAVLGSAVVILSKKTKLTKLQYIYAAVIVFAVMVAKISPFILILAFGLSYVIYEFIKNRKK